MLLHFRTLKVLEQPVESWDTLLIQILFPKLESTIREEWQECTNDSDLPLFKEFTNFLTTKSNKYESVATDTKENNHNSLIIKRNRF